jgi:hypothetical protein
MRGLPQVGRKRASLLFRSLGAVCTGLLTALSTLSFAAAMHEKHEKTEGPAPTTRIATEPLDYHPLSSFYLLSRKSSSSLDFIDSEHLLFTFRVTGLLKRLPECGRDDEDQLIRALVVHLPDGKIERSAEWRMHDRGRYLWALGNGRFLVRQQDSLETTDASLELHPFLSASSPLRLVKLSPDLRLLLVETDFEKHTEDEHRRLAEAAQMEGIFGPREDVQLTILRVSDRSVLLRARSLSVVDLPLISEGYIETLGAQGDHWMLRYLPLQGKPSVIGDIASSCHPSEMPLNDLMTFVVTCSHSDDHLLQAVSLRGKTLWTYRWDSHYIWPTKTTSESGQRIAISTLRVARPVSAYDPFDETEVQAQRVDVLDAETGRVELTQYATPVLSAGQNYALSPDGGRFAVLRDNAIEIYDLPPAGSKTGGEE